MITVSKQELLKSLQLVNKAISSKAVIPLYTNAKMTVSKDKLELFSTNFEISIHTFFDIKSKDVYSTAVPAKLFQDFINVLGVNEVSLNYKENELLIETDKSKNKIKCLNADDFMSFQIKDEGIELDAEQFIDAVNKVSFASSSTEGSALQAVQILIDNGKLVLFATDGLRLSVAEIPLDKKYKKSQLNVMIKGSALNIVSGMLSDTIKLSATDKQFFIQSGNTEIACQVLDGKMPDYKVLKPSKHNSSLVLKKTELIDACKQIELFSKESGFTRVAYTGLILSLSAIDEEKGNSHIDLPIQGNGQFDLGLNIFFLHQLLNVIDEEIEMKVIDEKNPIVFEMDNFYHIIMPMAR